MKPLSEFSAQDLFKLLRLKSSHPDQEGYPYSRQELLHECSSRGKCLLQDLGWPTGLDTLYWSWHCPDHKPERLRDILRPWRWDEFKDKLHDAEKILVNNSVLPDWVGLECWNIKDFKKAVDAHPELHEQIKEAVRLHKGFYEHCIGVLGRVMPIGKFPRECECEQNIARMWRYLGQAADVIEPLETLPKPSNYAGVWSVVEFHTPERPSCDSVIIAKAKQDFVKLREKAVRENKKSVQAPLFCFEQEAVV